MRLLRNRNYLLALPLAVATAALAIGLPTDVLPNPWFTRMTPVRTTDVILLPLTSLVLGALAATIVFRRGDAARAAGAVAGSGVASAFAVGCPVCNKLVVALIGFSGALSYFAPIQPVLGIGALLLALVALRRRIRALAASCDAESVRLAAEGTAPLDARAV